MKYIMENLNTHNNLSTPSHPLHLPFNWHSTLGRALPLPHSCIYLLLIYEDRTIKFANLCNDFANLF